MVESQPTATHNSAIDDATCSAILDDHVMSYILPPDAAARIPRGFNYDTIKT